VEGIVVDNQGFIQVPLEGDFTPKLRKSPKNFHAELLVLMFHHERQLGLKFNVICTVSLIFVPIREHL